MTTRKTNTASKSRAKRGARTTGTAASRQIELLETSFALLAEQADALVARFYEELFERFPSVAPMFENTDMNDQQKKLLAALKLVVNSLRNPDKLMNALTELGRKHRDYGAQPEHYAAVAETLLDVMAEFAGNAWTDDVKQAWTEALKQVADVMIKAGTMETDMATNRKEVQQEVDNSAATELTKFRGAIDGAMTAIMMVDRDLVITYVNRATLALLKKHEASLRETYPGFDADKLLGSCIDQFHKNPQHQRQLLSDPANLPYQTDISVGSLKFALNVTAIVDDSGRYIGNSLEWSNVTEQRAKELEVARLQSAVDGAQTNLMLCDTDLTITYVNPAVVEMLIKREDVLRQTFPGFDPRNLVGTCIDVFHKNPAHQRALLSDPKRLPASAEIKIADLEFKVNATAIVDPQGNLMGNMVEWVDITVQKDAERQIQAIVDGAVAGDFTNRVDVTRYDGFFRQLGELLNQLMKTSETGLNEVVRVLRALSKGDLNETITNEYEGLFGQLKEDSNTTVAQLRDMVNKILEAGANIGSAAGEIAQGNQDLSQRTEEQASNLEETASSMEELTSTVKQNADNAREANQLAGGAREQAEKGGAVVGRAVDAMSEINTASKKIADIIGVIDEIAFQTNLLALNAAVEAARAGEQGRGFAVVAGEVRNLAQRSATAAKEIKGLIQDSVEKVADGTKLVDESGETLGEIVNGVKKVSDIIAEIAAASQEQSAGIEQVNKAVMQMDEVTQQNAALVEEAAAASEALDDQANGLNEMMTYFDMGDNGASRAAPAARSKRPTAPRTATRKAAASRPQPAASGAGDDGEWEEF